RAAAEGSGTQRRAVEPVVRPLAADCDLSLNGRGQVALPRHEVAHVGQVGASAAENLDRPGRVAPPLAAERPGVGGDDAALQRPAQITAASDPAAEVAVAEVAERHEVPFREEAAAAVRPAVEPVAEAGAAVIAGVIADGAPADVARTPIPVDPCG